MGKPSDTFRAIRWMFRKAEEEAAYIEESTMGVAMLKKWEEDQMKKWEEDQMKKWEEEYSEAGMLKKWEAEMRRKYGF